jgi:hypothetical protein
MAVLPRARDRASSNGRNGRVRMEFSLNAKGVRDLAAKNAVRLFGIA